MNRFLSAALFLTSVIPAGAQEKAEPYRLRPGDSAMISVWREDSLQREVRVLPDGSITFPLAGRIEVAGLSTPEAERRIAVKLKEYLPEPVVSIVITGIEGNRAYVLGKVLKPGPVVMSGPTTVLQALSIAGGLDKFADEGAIRLVRRGGSTEEVLAINYKSLVAGRDMSTNFLLRAGDTLVVP